MLPFIRHGRGPGIVIDSVTENGVAAREGSSRVGDFIVGVNHLDLLSATKTHALHVSGRPSSWFFLPALYFNSMFIYLDLIDHKKMRRRCYLNHGSPAPFLA